MTIVTFVPNVTFVTFVPNVPLVPLVPDVTICQKERSEWFWTGLLYS